MHYEIHDYIQAFRHNPKLAVLPMQMVADFRGVSRAAIDRMIRIRQLQEVRIGRTRYVLADDLFRLDEDYNQKALVAREYLEESARRKEIVFYEKLMNSLGLSRSVPADRSKIGGILGRVSEESFAKNKILLTAIVHRKTSGVTKPGPGFLPLAKYLGFRWRDDREFLNNEVDRVFEYYSTTRTARRKRK